jgi:hypothetical protein
MTTQHTPGPWRVTAAKVMAENGRAICLIENRKLHEGFQESSANARLIAAAPDLLAALIAFDNAFSHYCEGDPDSDEVSALYQAREAIAKATGETA